MTEGEQTAYADGYECCLCGIHSSACPNKYQGALRYAWKEGWLAAYAKRPW
jgi:hypothetical protein